MQISIRFMTGLAVVALIVMGTFVCATAQLILAPGTPTENLVKVSDLTTIAEGTIVSLMGRLVEQIDGDEFIFQDDTGQVKVEIEAEGFGDQVVTPDIDIIISGKLEGSAEQREIDDAVVYVVPEQSTTPAQ